MPPSAKNKSGIIRYKNDCSFLVEILCPKELQPGMYLLENVIPAPLWANVTWGENLKKGREKG
jgi:hypothetical protein